MKSLADLKRYAKSGKIKLEMTYRYGMDLPTYCQGIRSITNVNSVGFTLVTPEGKESVFRYSTAKLTEYDGDTLIIYAPAQREPTPEEQAVLDEAKRIVDEYIKEYPYGEGWYWSKKRFFQRSNCPWMDGYKMIRGKRYLSHNGKVLGCSIKGEIIHKYIVHHV